MDSEQDYADKGLDYLEHNIDDGKEKQLSNVLSRKGNPQDCGTQLDVLTTHLHRNSPSATEDQRTQVKNSLWLNNKSIWLIILRMDLHLSQIHYNSIRWTYIHCIHSEQSGQDISTYESSQWHQCSCGYKLRRQHCENFSSNSYTSKNTNDNTWDQQDCQPNLQANKKINAKHVTHIS